ncbi:DMT family transporter [Bacillota bacterium]
MNNTKNESAKTNPSKKKIMYFLMVIMVLSWGLEYAFAKQALEAFEPITLLFFKYFIGLIILLFIKLKMEGRKFIKKKDIPMFLLCALFGEVGYFYAEYKAMSFLPVSIITIVLAFVPIVSLLIDRVIYKRKVTKKTVGGVLFCVVGIGLIIGVDLDVIFEGRIFGYILAFSAVIFWNVYNFITASLHERYGSVTLSFNQIVCALLLIWPYALTHLPEWDYVTPGIIWSILYLGLVSTAVGFVIVVKALHILGPTVTSMFSNFMPVTSTVFGWLLLKETIQPLQMLGGVIVITAGYFVIKDRS